MVTGRAIFFRLAPSDPCPPAASQPALACSRADAQHQHADYEPKRLVIWNTRWIGARMLTGFEDWGWGLRVLGVKVWGSSGPMPPSRGPNRLRYVKNIQ